jgi:FKBP-type peptidyl-prolyl cis-trans isomerase SlyD
MQVSNNKVVLLQYELKLNSGETVDTASAEQPFAFIHGVGQTLPAFDEKLAGLKKGDTFAFKLTADNAYGQPNEEDIVTIPKEVFGEMPDGDLQVGMELPMQDGQGHQFYGVVQEVQHEAVVMDFNHPLVGEDLSFSGTILEVREPSEEELNHGHVHGEGGHHH